VVSDALVDIRQTPFTSDQSNSTSELPANMALSERAALAAQPSNSSLISRVLQDPWHARNNPSGYVSFGLAENSLMHERLRQHVQENFVLPANTCTYGDGFTGSQRLKTAISRLLNRYLDPAISLEADHVIVTNGCSSALEQLAWALANPGEGFLLGRPYYTRLNMAPSLRAGAKIVPVDFGEADTLESIEAYKQAILKAEASGQKIAGLLLCNPHNPLGRCYPRETLINILRLCQRHRIHLISDEIYALSVWSNDTGDETAMAPFESCLSLATSDIINPSLVHVVWGMSKDFGANGFRVGAIISPHNPTLRESLLQGAIYSSISSISDHVACNLLEDEKWIDEYLLENRRRLAEHYGIVTSWATRHGIEFAGGVNAGFFLWLNFGDAYRARCGSKVVTDVEAEITRAFLEAKVFVAPGSSFGAERPGWFRLVFSVAKPTLEEGLSRILGVLNQ
jgi:aspartate/methionine/tyrosine aminotransferase